MPRRAYLWCPAYRLTDAQRLDRARSAAAGLAAACGWELRESPTLAQLGERGDWPPVAERRADLAQALQHDVLIAARGGYGCIDLVGDLLAHPGPGGLLIGYSDLTVLHALWRVRGWGGSLYGFLPGTDHGPRSVASTIAAARGQAQAWHDGNVREAIPLVAGRAEGWLFAGCLRVLAGLVGTPAMPDLRGAILALEDTDERPYQIDRDLAQLDLGGALTGVRGLVFGRFPAVVGDRYGGPDAAAVCRRRADRLGVPAVFGLPFGHDPDPLTLPIGVAATLEVGDGWRLGWSDVPRPTSQVG